MDMRYNTRITYRKEMVDMTKMESAAAFREVVLG